MTSVTAWNIPNFDLTLPLTRRNSRKPAQEHIVCHIPGGGGDGGRSHAVKPSHLLNHTNYTCEETAYNVLYLYVLCTVLLVLVYDSDVLNKFSCYAAFL